VAKSNKNVQYIIRCQILSSYWGVWLRRIKNEIHKWKVSRVKQPHTCDTSEVRHVHSQCKYITNTFLTEKYKGTLMVIVGMTAKNQLLSLAFMLVKGENNESWSWFLGLVIKDVLGLGRSIFIISDRHRGLLNSAKEHLEGYPPLIHR
jgi:hypothetical protein